VESALTVLATAGDLGASLVDFFRSLDAKEGITIWFTVFFGLVPEGRLMAPPLSNLIMLHPGYLSTPPSANVAAFFGHEVFHLQQSAFERISMRGELHAYQVEYLLRVNLGIAQTSRTNAAVRQDGTFYDLTSLSDVSEATTKLRNAQGGPAYSWQPNIPYDEAFIRGALRVSETAQQAVAIGLHGLHRASQGAQALIEGTGALVSAVGQEIKREVESFFSFQWLFNR
jgi:hypothetical protein